MEAAARVAVKTLPILLCLCMTIAVAWGALPDEVEDAVPPDAQELLEELDTGDPAAMQRGVGALWQKIRAFLPELCRESTRNAATVLGTAFLCALVTNAVPEESGQIRSCVSATGILAVTVLSTRELESVMAMGAQMMEELDIFSKALLPALTAAVAAGGGIISAGLRQTAMIFFSNLLIGLVTTILLPLNNYYVALCAISALLPEQKLSGLAAGMKKGITWVLTGSLLLFTGYLTVSGAAATSADALTVQLTKNAISTAVPVVGGIISDAAGSVLYSAGLLKNTLGVAGMLAILATVLFPFIRLAIQYLLYKLVGFLSGLLGNDAISDYISCLGSAFGLLLGMTGSCAVLLLICVASCVSVVVL